MSRSFSVPRAMSTASKRSLSARSAYQAPRFSAAMSFAPSYAKTKATKLSTSERLNPLLPSKNAHMTAEKRLEGMINTYAKKFIKFILDDESKQLEYTSIILELKKVIKKPDAFWKKWFEFKANFLEDVESCKCSYEEKKNPEMIREMCNTEFSKFSAEISDIHSLHRDNFIKTYSQKYSEMIAYFNQLQNIISKQLNRRTSGAIFFRDLPYILTQIEGFRNILPRQYDRFFSEPVYSFNNEQTQPMTKRQVIQRVMEPIDNIIQGIKVYMDPSIAIKQAKEEITKQQNAIKNLIAFPESARALQRETQKMQNEHQKIQQRMNQQKRRDKLQRENNNLKAEQEKLNQKLANTMNDINTLKKDMFNTSQNWEEEKRELTHSASPNNKTSGGSLSQSQQIKIKELEAQIEKKQDELNKLTDADQIEEINEENNKLLDAMREIRKKFKTAEKAVNYQRALIQAKVDALNGNDQFKSPYQRSLKLVETVNEISDEVKSTQYLVNKLREIAERRSKVDQWNLNAIPDPERKFPQILTNNNTLLELIKSNRKKQDNLRKTLRKTQFESNMTYALEEITAETGERYEKACRKLKNAIEKINLPPDDRSLPVATAEVLSKQADIASVQCQIDAIKKDGTIGVETLEDTKRSADEMILRVKAREKALSSAIKKAQSADAAQKISSAADAAESEVLSLKDELETYSDAFSSVESKLGIRSDGSPLPERINRVIQLLSN